MKHNTSYQSGKKRNQKYASGGVFEQLRDVGGNVKKAVTHDLIGQTTNDAFSSMFGGFPQSGEFRPDESFYPYDYEKPKVPQRPAFDEEGHKRKIEAEKQLVVKQLEAIRADLKVLASSVRKFSQEVDRAINEVPVDPGIYHVTFMEQLRSFIQDLRRRVDNSSAWLNSFNSRKKKKGFWGMYKKHGTTFGLSQERTASTQSG